MAARSRNLALLDLSMPVDSHMPCTYLETYVAVCHLASSLQLGKAFAELPDKLLARLRRRLGVGRVAKLLESIDPGILQVVARPLPALLLREQLDEEIGQRAGAAEEDDVEGARLGHGDCAYKPRVQCAFWYNSFDGLAVRESSHTM